MRWLTVLLVALALSGCADPAHESGSWPEGPPRGELPSGPVGDVVPRDLTFVGGNWTLGNWTRDDGRVYWPLPPSEAGGDGPAWNGTAPTVVGPATPTWSGSVFILGQSTGAPQASIFRHEAVARAGVPVTFTASAYDPDGTIVSWAWEFGDGAFGTGVQAAHTYATAGTRTVRLVVTSSDGQTAAATTTVDVAPASTAAPAPSLSISFVPRLVLFLPGAFGTAHVGPGDEVPFSVLAIGPEGTTYAWDFGDGSNATGASVRHAYAAVGDYTVRVVATAPDGSTAEATRTVHVRLLPPVASIHALPLPPGSVRLTARAMDYDGRIVAYHWDLGDGTTAAGPEARLTRHGTYDVTLTVTDDDGLTGTATAQVTVDPQPPTVFAIHTSTGDEPRLVRFGAGASDPDGAIVAWAWDFGDGATSSEQAPSHQYAEGGTYTVTLTVTDDEGLTGTRQQQVHVPVPYSS